MPSKRTLKQVNEALDNMLNTLDYIEERLERVEKVGKEIGSVSFEDADGDTYVVRDSGEEECFFIDRYNFGADHAEDELPVRKEEAEKLIAAIRKVCDAD